MEMSRSNVVTLQAVVAFHSPSHRSTKNLTREESNDAIEVKRCFTYTIIVNVDQSLYEREQLQP